MMKKSILFIIVIMLIPLAILGQDKHIFFELKDSEYLGIDSIKVNSKIIKEFKNFVKIPRKKRVKILIFKNGKCSKLKLKTTHLDLFNTIESISESYIKTNNITIKRGSTNIIFTEKKKAPPYYKVTINVHKRIFKDGKFYTGSKSFDSALENNPEFFISN